VRRALPDKVQAELAQYDGWLKRRAAIEKNRRICRARRMAERPTTH